jgi:hypothetical protein
LIISLNLELKNEFVKNKIVSVIMRNETKSNFDLVIVLDCDLSSVLITSEKCCLSIDLI